VKRWRIGLAAIAAAIVWVAAVAHGAPAAPPERVTFPTLDGGTTLTGFVFRPATREPSAALVLLHGCTGLGAHGRIFPVYRSWARLLAEAGYLTLMVDSAGSRHIGQTCTASPDRRRMMRARPRDAYAALRYLQTQPSVRPDRIGAVGWSQGGATVLNTIALQSPARPPDLKQDFRAAVAFYPGRCSDKMQSRPFVNADPGTWTTAVPLLVLLGESDNWTPAAPCTALLTEAKARKAPVEFKLYPGAYHVFDAPNLPVRELPHYRMANGVVPISGTDAAARADARVRVPQFLRRYLRE